MYNNYLVHHGIKGQRWGIRRYQNIDGSLTAEGKKHYNNAVTDVKLTTSEKVQRSDRLKKAGIIEQKNGDYVLKKDSRINRYTDKKESVDDRQKYASITEHDKKEYLESMKDYLNGDHMYLETYKAKKDLKMASKTQVESFILNEYGNKTIEELLSKEKKLGVKSDYNKAIDNIIRQEGNTRLKDVYKKYDTEYSPQTKRAKNMAMDKWVGDSLSNSTKARFIANRHAAGLLATRQVLTNMMDNKKLNDEMNEHFIKKGYDAVTDINDARWITLDLPIILLKPKDSVYKEKTHKIF